MSDHQIQSIRNLIPDLLPPDHISLNKKRVRFINGEGVVLYDNVYAVEIYLPNNNREKPEYFGVQKHHGRIRDLYSYFRKPTVLAYDSPQASDLMRKQFEEAVFQFEPLDEKEFSNVLKRTFTQKVAGKADFYLGEPLEGAA